MIVLSRKHHLIGAVASFVGAVLFTVGDVIKMVVGAPPSTGSELLPWVATNQLLLSAENEIMVLSAAALIPTIVVLAVAGFHRRPVAAGTAAALFVVASAIRVAIAVIHGRWVYPVRGLLADTADSAVLVSIVVGGGEHTVGLLIGAAVILISAAIGGEPRFRGVGVFGTVAGLAYTAGSLAWSPVGHFGAAGLRSVLALWLLSVGFALLMRARLAAAGETE